MTERSFVVAGARVTYERASIAELEAAAPEDPEARLETLLDRDGVGEAFVLRTCNRVEEYVAADTAADGRDALADFGEGVPDEAAVRTGHEASLRHLLRVAAGLESQVLGEDQILGQVRDAYERARDAGAIGPALEPGLLKAIHVGERARSETAINEGTVSLGSAAVDLAERERGLEDAVALVVGTGEMGTLVAEAFADAPVDELRIVNRTRADAAALADRLDAPARADALDALPRHVRAADVAVSTTGSREHLIEPSTVADAGETLLVDVAQPRDVAPAAAEVDGVAVCDLDGLEAITDETHAERREAAAEVEALIDEEFDLLMEQYKRQRADAVIRAMYQGADRIKERELARALSELDDLDGDEREVVEALADSLVSQLMAVPTESLRDAAAEDDWATIATAIELFDPTGDEGESPFDALSPPDGAPAESSE